MISYQNQFYIEVIPIIFGIPIIPIIFEIIVIYVSDLK